MMQKWKYQKFQSYTGIVQMKTKQNLLKTKNKTEPKTNKNTKQNKKTKLNTEQNTKQKH